jgi:hypothetical protein
VLWFKILGNCTVATLAIKYNTVSHMGIRKVNCAFGIKDNRCLYRYKLAGVSSGDHGGHKPSCILSHACVTEHLSTVTGKMSRNCTVHIPCLIRLSALRSSCHCGCDFMFIELFGLDFRSTVRALC